MFGAFLQKTAISLLLVLLWGNSAWGGDSNIDIPFTKFKLDNGLTVIVHEDRKAPIVAINISYHVGSKDEKPGKTGLAHLFEHLMFNGSENYKDEFFRPFEKVGATNINGTTRADRTSYFENVPTSALDLALWMESDRMGHLLGVVDQVKLDEQRGVVENEVRQGDNRPYGRTYEIIHKAMFPLGHPYSWVVAGSMEDLKAAKLTDVHEWFQNNYGAANAVIVLAGDIDAATARKKVQEYFSDIPSGPPLTKREAWIAKLTENKRDIMFDRVPQTRLIVSWNTPPFGALQADQLTLVASLLGGGKNSRLYKTLVQDKQLATSVNVSNTSYELASTFQISADVKPGVDYHDLEKLIHSELNSFLQNGPAPAELQRAKTSIEATFIRDMEAIGGSGSKSDLLATYETYLGDAGAYKTTLKNYSNATPAQLQGVAREWLSHGSYTLEVQPFPQYTVANSTVDRSKLPETNSVPDLIFPKLQRASLANGLNIILAERHSIPTVNISMQFNAGYAADQGAKPGTANFTMAMLSEGTATRTAQQLSETLEGLGANFKAGCSLDSCSVNLDTLTKNIDASLDLYSDLLLQPLFPEQNLRRLRSQWLAGISQEKVDPEKLALRLLPQLLYGAGHPYAAPATGSGTEAGINSLTREDLLYFQKKWMRADNATLIVVDDITMKDLLPKLTSLFSQWSNPPQSKPSKNIAQVALPATARVFLLDKPDAIQSLIVAGEVAAPSSAPSDIAMRAMNGIFGASFTSRLNMNLREDKHWSYGAGSRLVDAVGQRSHFVISAVQADKTIESVQEIRKEAKHYVSSKPATVEELQKIVMRTTRALPGRYETGAAVQEAIGNIVRFGQPDNYVETLKQQYEALTLGQLNSAAANTIKPDNLTWVIVGDLKKIEQGIRDLNIGELSVLDGDGNRLR